MIPTKHVYLPQIAPAAGADPYETRGGAWTHLQDLLGQTLEANPRVKILADGNPESVRFEAIVAGWVDMCKIGNLLHPSHEPLNLVVRWAVHFRCVSLAHRDREGRTVSLEEWWAGTHPAGKPAGAKDLRGRVST